MWPDDGRDNVLPHIPNSQIQIATGYTASPFDLVKKLNDCLVDPLRTDYDLFRYLKSDHDAQSIINNKLNEMLDKVFITKMSEKYPKVNVSDVLDGYILFAKTHKDINDHHKNFEQWMLRFNKRK